MGKILLIDVDGTLVDYEDQVPDSAVEAIRKARENGHRVYICTGRSKAEVYPNLWDIGLDGMIGGNGSYVEDHGEVVMHRLSSKEQCVYSVCMGSGGEEAKAAADFVTTGVDEDGLYKAFEYLELLRGIP